MMHHSLTPTRCSRAADAGLLALALFIPAWSLQAASDTQTANVIRNPGFEQVDAAGQAPDWRWYNNMGERPTALTHFSVDTNTFNVLPFCTNGHTARVVNGIRPDGTKDGNGGFVQSRIPVQGGAVYLFSMKHVESAEFDANLYVCITQHDAAGTSIAGDAYYFATNIQPGLSWRVWSRLFTPKPETVSIDLIIVPNGRGTAWFDDFALVRQPDAASEP